MALYARSDLMSVSIPATSGGCGETHTRPVVKGAPRKVWKLECPACEAYLRGDHKRKVIRVTGGDKNKGIPGRMEHVPDADPHWSNSPEGIPQTPDEEGIHARRAEVGQQQLRMLEALAAAKQAGMSIPTEAWWLLEQNLDPKVLEGTLTCSRGHENRAGAAFCNECGENLRPGTVAEKEPEKTAEPAPLDRLHVQTLRKMAREQGLPDNGTKEQLIERLS